MANFTLTAGIDDYFGVIGEDNIFTGLVSDLTSDDTVTGSPVPGSDDRLILSGGGNLSAADLSGVSRIELIVLQDGTSIELDDALLSSTNTSRFEIRASDGVDVIDASGLTDVGGNVRLILDDGDTTYLDGSNNTLVFFSNGELTENDAFVGGGGSNIFSARNAVTLTATDISNVSGVKTLSFRDGGSVEFIDGFGNDGEIRFSSKNDQDDVVDGSALLEDGMRIRSGGGSDTLTGGAQRDLFYFNNTSGQLDATDIVDGNGGWDLLVLQGAGVVTADDMAGVAAMPNIRLGNGNISLELSDTVSDRNFVNVDARNGTKVVDASGLDELSARVEFNTGTSTFLGGSRNDRVTMTASHLGDEDTLDGAAGDDELVITTSATVTAGELANVTNFEELTFTQGADLTLTDGFATGDALTINLSDGVDVIDGSAETTAEIIFNDVGGIEGTDDGDILTGGGASDTFVISNGDFVSIDGGAGDFNRIVLGESLSEVDLTEPQAQSLLSSIQVVELSAAAGTLMVDAAAVSAISGSGQELFVLGDAADQVEIQGTWTPAGTRSVPELSATPFDVYTAVTGETLLVLQGVQVDITVGSPPTDLDLGNSSIAENDAGGVIGAITVTDADVGDSHTFEIDDMRFEVVAGDLRLKDGLSLDREVEESVDLLVTVTDLAGGTYSETFTIDVTDVNEFDVSAPVDGNAAANVVAENAAAGAGTGITVSASDDDATMSGVSFSTNDARFEVNGAGELVVAAGAVIDRESVGGSEITVEVTATSDDGSTATETFTIDVTDVNEFDVSAPVDGNAAANVVAENAAAGAGTGITVSASDDDATMSGVSFSTNDARFEVNGAGELVVAAGAVIDRESVGGSEITVEVTATSDDGSTATETFTIDVTDVNEFDVSAPVDGNAAANVVAENAAAGAGTGITVSASDDDATMSGVSFSTNDARFEVNGAGELVVAAGAVIDRESVGGSEITVEVTATSDDGSTATETFTIDVTDVNEFDVSAPVDGNAAANVVAENAAAGAGTGITVSASDDDATMSGVSFSTNDARFEVNGAGELVVAAGAVIDRESVGGSEITVEVTATSDDGSTATETFTIDVTDVNEFDVSAPVDGNAAANVVAENAAAGAGTGITVSASDDDATMSGVSFSTNDARFEVNGAGELVVAAGAVIDRESVGGSEITVEVTATSDDGSTATETFTIDVTDVNEFDVSAPVDGNAAANVVAENAAAGAGTGITVSASDDDATMSGVSFSTNDARFEVNGAGELVVAAGAVIDRESVGGSEITVEVTATSDDGSTATETFTIDVTDVNDVAPQITSAATENVSEGSLAVLTLTASDADTTGEPTLFSISGGADADLFEIVNGSELRFKGAPDFEAPGDAGEINLYDVVIEASDGTNSSTQAIAVSVTDVNEPPTVSLVQTVSSIDENTDVSAGVKVADIEVADDSLGTNDRSLSGADAGRFEIRGDELFFVGSAPDFEAQSQFDVSVDLDDADITGAPDSSAGLSLDINDLNEAPVAVADAADAVEDVLVAPTGNLLANDTDADGGQDLDVLSVNGSSALVGGDLVATGTYGELVVDPESGDYTYTLNATTAQVLAAGQVVTDTFTYVAADDGTPVETASSSLVVTVTGTNDEPIATADTASVTEDVTLSATGNVIAVGRGDNAQGPGDATDTDADVTDVLTVTAVNGLPGSVGSAVEGIYGNLTVEADGDYTYTLGVTAAQQAAVDALREGDAPEETFTYTITDTGGDSDATTLKVTVNGTNDIPTLSVDPLTGMQTSGESKVVAVDATASDPDSDISVITLSLSVLANSNAGDTALDSADALGFDASFQAFLTSQGFTVTGDGNGSDLVITAPAGEPLGDTFAEAILEQVKYTAGDSSFGFNANDRVVSVTLTDIAGASSTPVEITIDMQANVAEGDDVNVFVGGNLADIVSGGAGDDMITGLEGDDAIDGGADTDTAVYQGDLSGYDVSTTADASGFVTSFDTVEDTETATTDEGTDTLTSIEVLQFQDQTITLANAVQLFNGTPGAGNLSGTFDTIQAAIDAAAAGDTILVNGTGGTGGTAYAGSESLTIDKGLTIQGLGNVSVVSIAVSGGGAGQIVDIDNLDVAAASNASSAVHIDQTADYDSVTFQNGDVTGGTQHGLLVGSGANPVLASNTARDVDAIIISNAAFSGNGTAPSNGSGGLTFFGYNNDLTLSDVTVTGNNTHNGIQLRGLDQSAPAGTVVFDGVEISGAFLNTGMAIYNYADISGLNLAGDDLDGSLDINVTAAFAGLNIDGVGGDIDLAAAVGLAVSNGNPISPDISVNAAVGDGANLLTGDSSDDVLTGNDGNDDLQGNGGSDILFGGMGDDLLSGGAGDDTIVQVVGEGTADDIDGGSETDTVLLLDTAATDDAISVVYNGSALTSLDGADLAAVEIVTAHVDTTFGPGGSLVPLAGDTGSDTLNYTGTTAAVTVDLEDGTATGFDVNPLVSSVGGPNTAISGFENVTGGTGDDRLDGSATDNIIDGGAGVDTTEYEGTVTAAQFTATATGWQVATSAEGTDTLEGIERVDHADGSIFLVGNGGYASIQAAIDVASNGDTILVAPGTYAEDLALDVAVSIIGVSGDAEDVIIASARIGSGLTGAAALTIEIANMTVDAAEGIAASGIVYAGSYDGTSNALGGLTLENLDVSGFAQTGIVVIGGGAGFTAEVTDVTVSDSGATGTSGGSGGITFFEFLGDAAFDSVSVDGNSANADHGIQIAGFRDSDNAIIAPIGTVTFTDTEVTGTFGSTLAFVQGYNDLAGLDFTGGLTLDGTASWTGLYVNPTFGGNVTSAAAPSSIDLTGVDVTGGSYGTSPGFAGTGNAGVVVIGIGVNGTITGSNSDPDLFVGDALVGTGANETINAGAGDDIIVGGGGLDRLNGGTGDDTFVAFSYVGGPSSIAFIDGGSDGGAPDSPGDTVIFSSVFPDGSLSPADGSPDPITTPNPKNIFIDAVTNIAGDPIVTVSDSTNAVLASDIENIRVFLGDGGSDVYLTNDLGANGLANLVVGPDDASGAGGAGNDRLIAWQLADGDDVALAFESGGGNDSFAVNVGAAGYTYHAGETTESTFVTAAWGPLTGDTVDYTFFTTDVVVDLNDSGSGQSATGFDEISGVENVIGSVGDDTVTGNAEDNVFASQGGSDVFGGGAGDDTIDVPGPIDSFTYAVATDGTISLNNGVDVIEIAADVETLRFDNTTLDLTNPVRVVDAMGSLVATYATIQAAVDAAGTTDGMTVQILGQPTAFAESINTNGKALTFAGVDIDGNGVVIDPTAGNAFTINSDTSGGDVTFSNLTIQGGAEGIFVDDTANVGTLTIEDATIADNSQRGLYVLGESGVQEGAAEVVITDSTFSGNSENGSNGNSQIKLFGFSGDATFDGLIVDGAASTAAAPSRPDNAIEITGNVNGGSANQGGTPPDIGSIDFVDVTVTGAYHKNPVAIFNFGELDALTITDLDLSGAESNWGPLFNIDGVTDANIDASGYGITFPAGYGIVSEIQGEKIGQADVDTTIIGTDFDDRLHGKTGDDTLDGGAGDDQLYGSEKPGQPTSNESGNDNLTGGTGDDYLNGGAETDTGAGTPAEGDTAVYIGAVGDEITTADLTSVAGTDPVSGAAFDGWQVDAGGLGTDQGTDILNDIEIVETRDGTGALVSRILLVGNGGFDDIQAAVDEAQDGDTILIAGGTYAEQVVIDGIDDLSFVGLGEVTLQAGDTLVQTSTSGSARSNFAIVDVQNATGVTFENITVDGEGRGDEVTGGGNFLGVSYRDASGGLIDVDVLGIRDAYTGDTTADGFPVVKGNQRGVGVQVDNATEMDFEMTGGSISDFQKNATVFNRVDLTITGVEVTGGGAQTIIAQNGFQAINSTGTITGNTVNAFGYAPGGTVATGMILFDNTNLIVDDNIVTGSTSAAATVIGIYVFGGSGGSVSDNTISDIDTGVFIGGSIAPDQITVADNSVTNVDPTLSYAAGVLHAPDAALPTVFDVEGSESFDGLYGAAADDKLVGLAGDDYLDGRAGADTMDGGDGDDTIIVDNAADVVIEAVGEGDDTVEASVDYTLAADAEVETLVSDGTDLSLTGNIFAQAITGDAGENVLSGEGGDDVLTGGAEADVLIGGDGADTLYGTDDLGDAFNIFVDTATYDAGATIAWNDVEGRWEVTADGATDQLYGIEKVIVGTDTYLLVDDATDATAGGFISVIEAEAEAAAGDTILVANGTYAGATLTKVVTVQGMGNGAGETVFSSGFTVDLTADAAGAALTLRDFALENVAGTSIKAQDDEVLNTLRIQDVRVEGGSGSGLVVSGRKDSDAYDQAGVQKVEIIGSDFIDNAQSGGNNGNIVLFEFDGDAEITDVTSSNAVTGASSAAYLVQIAGFDGPRYDQKTPDGGSSVGSYDVLTAMGSVVIDGLDISGDARKPGLYIQGYTDLTGLDIINSTVDVLSGWGTPVIIDPMADQSPLGTANTAANAGSFFDDEFANASYNLSGLSVVQKPSQVVVAEGTSQAETITGTNANDVLVGFGGDDILNGGSGDDQFIFGFGDGADTVDGGGDDDRLTVTGSAAADDVTISDTAVTIIGGGSVTFSNIENTDLDGDVGADTFRFVDTGLTGGPIYAVDGGADTNTLDFAGYDNGVTVSLIGSTFEQTGAAETHSVSNIANVDGGLLDDDLTGDNLANVLNGSDGEDVLVGLNGADILNGGAGNDELYGGNQDDAIYGGAGADLLNGGGGIDTFRYESLAEGTDGTDYDLILSYTSDSDILEIVKSGFGSLDSELTGVLQAQNFVNASVDELDGSYFGATPGQATFVFDDVGSSSGNRELWFDENGDGTAIKMLEFNSASNLSGFDENDFTLV